MAIIQETEFQYNTNNSNPLVDVNSLNQTDDAWNEWDQASGADVLDFIKSKLEHAVVNIEFLQAEDNLSPRILGYNAFGLPVCTTDAVIAEPTYSYQISINKLLIGLFTFTNDSNTITLSYSANMLATAFISIYTILDIAGKRSYILQARTYNIYWENSAGERLFIYNSINNGTHNSNLQGEEFLLDISSLFRKGFGDLRLVAELVNLPGDVPTIKSVFGAVEGNTGGTSFSEILLILSQPVSPLSNNLSSAAINAFTLPVSGITGNSDNYELEYYEYTPTEENDTLCTKGNSITLTNPNSVLLLFQSKGVHYIYARVKQKSPIIIQGTSVLIASDWVQLNLLVQTTSTGETEGAVVVSEIPTELTNCNATLLYRICTTDERACSVKIKAYLAETNLNIEDPSNLFNSLDINLLNTDASLDLKYYTYIELENITSTNNTKYGKFLIENNNVISYVPQFSVRGDIVEASSIFVFNIVLPAANTGNKFNYDNYSTPILNYSLIARGNVFDADKINPALSNADGWQTDRLSNGLAYTAFKVSPTPLGLFVNSEGNSQPLPLVNSSHNILLGTGLDFTIELMMRSEYVNDLNDEIFSIGNLKFYPGYFGVFNESSGKINIDSRADYLREEPTHIVITYKQNYRPSTYTQLYNSLLTGFSLQAPSYNCLKIYVNGVINREVELNPADLLHNNTFSFLVNPSSSNVLFYIFRTYEVALDYNQVKKNFISSKLYLEDKIEYYNNNNILFEEADLVPEKIGQISLKKCLDKYNVLLVAVAESDASESALYKDRPLYWNNKDLSVATTYLVHYKDTNLKPYCGKLYGGKLKAQGSSAKKYLIHNTSLSKFKYVCQYNEDGTDNAIFNEPNNNGTKYYIMPPYESVDSSGNTITKIPTQKVEKLVGKVNYASSMQSHKQGACKLYNDVFEVLYPNSPLNGGRKAVVEEAFLYFFVTIDCSTDENALNNITWSDEIMNKATFVGFQTWGSAKGDKVTSGYNSDTTPEYLLLEGADNLSVGANFKVPWAAFLKWTNPTLDANGQISTTYTHTEQLKDYNVTETNYINGLIINDETILYQTSGADALDVDFGCEAYIDTAGEESLYFHFTDAVINNSLPWFADFHNLIYLFDYSSYTDIPTSGSKYTAPWTQIWKSIGNNNQFHADCADVSKALKLIIPYTATIYINGIATSETALQGDIYRWDPYKERWVPAGLHYDGGNWRTLNIKNLLTRLCDLRTATPSTASGLGLKVETNIKDLFTNYSSAFSSDSQGNPFTYFQGGFSLNTYNPNTGNLTTFKLAISDLFKATCEKYLDVEDVKYHLAFIRYVSGTDNRAKNTYFVIYGRMYEQTYDYTLATSIVEGHTYYKEDGTLLTIVDGVLMDGDTAYDGDYYSRSEAGFAPKANQEAYPYKIRLFLDDLDTIFATDNNGQQVKPYYLLEPPYNANTEEMWGDMRSGLFYNFDISYSLDIITTLGQFINVATPNTVAFTDNKSMIKKYFLDIQTSFPAIAYNHTAEIFYDITLALYKGSALTPYANNTNVLRLIDGKSFSNNSVAQPLSLSHGSCYESELQFLTDRFKFLNTMASAGHISDNTMSLITGTGGVGQGITFAGTASYTLHLYPSFNNGDISTHSIIQLYSDIDTLKYDPFIATLDQNESYITILKQAVPGNTYNFYNMIQQTTTGAALSSTEDYKEIEITQGLTYLKDLVRFPNASKVTINGATPENVGDQGASYSLEVSEVLVKEYLPCIQDLTLLNVINERESGSKLDFRGCDRLSRLDLTGCDGFETVNLPTSNSLTKVILPHTLKTLTLDYYPNLTSTNFDFDGTLTNLTSLTIDCRNNENLLIKVINACPDSTNIILNANTSTSTILSLTNTTIKALSLKSNISVLGKITFRVVDNTGNLAPLSYADKVDYALKWGNIDDSNNVISLNYLKVSITSQNTYINSFTSISTDGIIPIGFTTTGNNFSLVKYEDSSPSTLTNKYIPKFIYTAISIPSGCTIDSTTGYISGISSLEEHTNIRISVSIMLDTGKFDCPVLNNTSGYATVTIGFRPPTLGDYAYSDGTFANFKDSTKDIVGLVFYSVYDTTQLKYDVRVCGNQAITSDVLLRNPSTALINVSTDDWWGSDLKTRGQVLAVIAAYITQKQDLSTTSFPANYDTANGTISFDNLNINLRLPESLPCGLAATRFYKAQAEDNYKKIKNNNVSLSTENDLEEAINYIAQNEHYSSIYYPRSSGGSGNVLGTGYYTVLNPAYTRTYLYEPENLPRISYNSSNFITNPYSKGHWYIPTSKEIELIVQYRIISAYVTNTETSALRWNSLNWRTEALLNDLGDNRQYAIFNATNADLPILSVGNYITCDLNGDTYLTYGSYLDYNGSSYSIGWHNSYTYYTDVDWLIFADYSLPSIVPFCRLWVYNDNGISKVEAYEVQNN